MTNGFTDMEIEGSGKYLRIKGGQKSDIHILSEHPVMIKAHGWGKDRVICTGEECPACEEGDSPKQRWMVNVLDRKDVKVKIFEFGSSVAFQIKKIAGVLAEDGETIHSVDLRIEVEGSGLETKYSVVQKTAGPVPENLDMWPLP